MTSRAARIEQLRKTVEDQRQWINEHGGDLGGYVARYGSCDDEMHYGNGGEAIYGVEKSFTTGRSPAVAAAIPDSGKRGQVLTVTISGGNFEGASAVSFGPGIVVRSFAVNGGTGITAEIAIDAAAEPGARDVSVTTGVRANFHSIVQRYPGYEEDCA